MNLLKDNQTECPICGGIHDINEPHEHEPLVVLQPSNHTLEGFQSLVIEATGDCGISVSDIWIEYNRYGIPDDDSLTLDCINRLEDTGLHVVYADDSFLVFGGVA